jgi:curli biogenesis system outer membrane secretion channel CsgG
MKYTHKHLIVAALLAAFGMAADAQTQPAPAAPAQGMTARQADPARMQQHMAQMQQRMAKRQAEFKQKLQLSPGQEAAWDTYVAALKPSGNFKRGDRAELARLTTPERIDRMRTHRAERIAAMDRRDDATKTFYGVLTPDQKKVFDDTTAKRGQHRQGAHQHG